MPVSRHLLAILPFLAVLPTAHSQILSVYGTFSPVRVSDIRNGNSSGTNGGYSTTSFWTPGVGGGLTYGALPIGPVHLGLDLRGSTKPGTNGSDTVMAGVRAGLKLPFVKIKPYVQASGGYLATRTRVVSGGTTGATSTDHFAAYEVMGGVDYSFLPFFDLRLVEIGAGKGYQISGAGDTAGSYTPTLFTVNTGLVFHF